MQANSKIYVAGHSGLVGSAICRSLARQGFVNIVRRSHGEVDLTDEGSVARLFADERPEYVFLAAAHVGGILANSKYPVEFIRTNIAIQSNVIEASFQTGVRRLLFLGSSCIYPRICPQPIKEEYLLTGPLEPTNRSYAIAKIAGIEMCWAYNRQYGARYLAAMPTNLYGPADNYDLENSHVLPALVRKVIEAKIAGRRELTVWGSGTPRREFLYSDDLGDACVFLLSLDDEFFDSLLPPTAAPIINVGVGEDLTICELAELVCRALDFEGKLVFDSSMPDGTPRKLLDSSRINSLGWRPMVPLELGVRLTCAAAPQIGLASTY